MNGLRKIQLSWLLTTAVALCVTGSVPADEPLHEYVGAERCKTCHKKERIGDQYAVWKDGPHHRAHDTLGEDAAKAIAKKLDLPDDPDESPDCLPCHVTGFGLAPSHFYKDLDHDDGVQCESCHGPGRDYRKKKIMSDRDVAEQKGLWDPGANATRCTGCHNPRSPTWDPARYSLPGGGSAGFDFEQAKQRIAHPIPEDVKGRYIELEDDEKD